MSFDAFFAWQEAKAERDERVDGVPAGMMPGARDVHDDIVVNLPAFLRTALRGGGCPPFARDGGVETLPGKIRRPGIGVDCGPRDPNGLEAAQLRVVIEVLSQSARDFDASKELAEYRAVAALDQILLVEPNAAEIRLWSRDAGRAWIEARILGLDATVALAALDITLARAEIYDGVTFPVRLTHASGLVADEPGGSTA